MQKESLCGGLALASRAGGIDATLIDQKADEAVHRGIVGAADQRRHPALLRDESGQDQPMQMMRKRGGREAEFFLQAADRQAVVAGANERAIDLEPGRIAERFELLCRLF
jgi:hypothetical protein